jgi:hypothetical protein
MEIFGKFYSRRQGWNGGNKVKYFNSSIINKLPEINLDDKDGKYISNYLKKNNLENEYKELYSDSKIYSNWYFYYSDDIKIFSSESL